jgi:hypothetical protein
MIVQAFEETLDKGLKKNGETVVSHSELFYKTEHSTDMPLAHE